MVYQLMSRLELEALLERYTKSSCADQGALPRKIREIRTQLAVLEQQEQAAKGTPVSQAQTIASQTAREARSKLLEDKRKAKREQMDELDNKPRFAPASAWKQGNKPGMRGGSDRASLGGNRFTQPSQDQAEDRNKSRMRPVQPDSRFNMPNASKPKK